MAFLLLAGGCTSSGALLSNEEREWLKAHEGKLIVGKLRGWPPLEDIDDEGNHVGLAVDYLELIESRIGHRFVRDAERLWPEQLDRAFEGRIHVLTNIHRTPQRSRFLLFTPPYLTSPYVLVTRTSVRGDISLDNIGSRSIIISGGTSIEELLRVNHPGLDYASADSDLDSLLRVAAGNVDAAAVSLDSASRIIRENSLTDLKIASITPYTLSLSFASTREYPLLNSILTKALADITLEEHQQIRSRWISSSQRPFYARPDFWIPVLAFAAFVGGVLVALVFWNRSRARAVHERTSELQDSRERFDLAMQVGRLGLWDWDITSGKVHYNEDWMRLYGYSPGELEHRFETWLDRLHPDDRPATLQILEDHLAGKLPEYHAEFRILHRSGEWQWHSASGNVVKTDENGSPLRAIGIQQDITRIKQAEIVSQQAQNHLANVINSLPSAIVTVDLQFRITGINRLGQIMAGISPGDNAQGRPFFALFTSFSDLKPALEKELQQGNSWMGRPQKFGDSGREQHFRLSMSPLSGESFSGAVIRIDDVTELIRMEETIIQTEKMISVGGLAAGMAHEINNPLGAILQGAQNIQRRLDPSMKANQEAASRAGCEIEAIRTYLEDRSIMRMLDGIRSAGERAARIVVNMLNFSRRSESQAMHVSINELMESALELAANDYDLAKKYDFRSIDIEKDFEDDLPPVQCIPTEIEQVVLNLLRNAAQAMGGDDGPLAPRIIVRTRQDLDDIIIEIEDNGPGLPPEVRRRVFEPFFTTKSPGSGTGLGLSVSYFIITENHGGRFAVESEPGQGARFIIRLPGDSAA